MHAQCVRLCQITPFGRSNAPHEVTSVVVAKMLPHGSGLFFVSDLFRETQSLGVGLLSSSTLRAVPHTRSARWMKMPGYNNCIKAALSPKRERHAGYGSILELHCFPGQQMNRRAILARSPSNRLALCELSSLDSPFPDPSTWCGDFSEAVLEPEACM